jgi:hypothetical protein
MRVMNQYEEDDRVVHIERVRADRAEGASHTARPHDERTLGDLFSELSRETSTLFRQEVRLAKTEATEKAKVIGKDVAFMAAGGAIAYAGFLVILGAIVVGLAFFMPLWLSALLVGIVVAAIGGFLAYKGLGDLRNAELAPKQTIQSLQEDKEWVKEQVR